MTAGQTSECTKCLPALLAAGILTVVWAGCATASPFIANTGEKTEGPSPREGGDANDVFLRAPWELWRMPSGTGRYHRGAHMLLPDKMESFQIAEISVYQPDGSDVRLDYYSVDLGGGSQSHESISVFVYRAPRDHEVAWREAIDRMTHKWPGAATTNPFPVAKHHPEETRQMAWVAPARGSDKDATTFVQLTMFQEGPWVVRYEISCPAADVDVTREKTRAFLRSIRAKEWSDRIQ